MVPVVLLQVVVSVAFVQRLYEDVTRQMTRALILELAYLRDVANAAPDIASAAADAAVSAHRLNWRSPCPPRTPRPPTSAAPSISPAAP